MDANMEYQSETQTLLGKKEKVYIDTETGEKIYAEQITKRAYGQKQFWKIYLIDFLHILGLADSKQIDVLIYILQNTEQANNTFVGTYKKIAREAKVSEPTEDKLPETPLVFSYTGKVGSIAAIDAAENTPAAVRVIAPTSFFSFIVLLQYYAY